MQRVILFLYQIAAYLENFGKAFHPDVRWQRSNVMFFCRWTPRSVWIRAVRHVDTRFWVWMSSARHGSRLHRFRAWISSTKYGRAWWSGFGMWCRMRHVNYLRQTPEQRAEAYLEAVRTYREDVLCGGLDRVPGNAEGESEVSRRGRA